MNSNPHDLAHARLTFRLAAGLVGIAGLVAVWFAIDLGYHKASVAWMVIPWALGLVAVAGAELLAWHNAADAWHERRVGSITLWALLAVICSTGTLWTNFNTSANNTEVQSSVHKAAFTKTINVTGELKAAQADRDRLQEKVGWYDTALNGKAVRTPEAAQADIEKAKAHRFWQLTSECTETKGPQTRSFCEAYRTAQSEKSMAVEKVSMLTDLKLAQGKVDDLTAKSEVTPMVVADDAPGIKYLQKIGYEEDTARQLDAMTLPLLMQALLVLGGIQLANERHRNKPRLPWIDFAKIGKRWRTAKSLLTGEHVEHPVAQAPYSTADAQVEALRAAVEKMQRRPVDPVKTPATTTEKHTHELVVVEKADPFLAALRNALEDVPALKAA